jgi:transcriptional antiterminator
MGQPPNDTGFNLEVDARQLIILSNLYMSTEWPYNFLTLEQVASLVQVSKNTIINIMRDLQKQGLVVRTNSYITFYYPTKSNEVRKAILKKLGITK